MRLKILFFSCFILFIPLRAQGQDHQIFSGILTDYVQEGMVDYQNLCPDPRLQEYIHQLSKTDPQEIKDENARLAFWLNAYNAYTLKIICDNYPLKSINELHSGGLIFGSLIKGTVWHKKIVMINNDLISLDAIEHQIIRREFDEPRIHFALVCAAKSCPPLRGEAYEGGQLDSQLQDQGKIFFTQTEKNRIAQQEKVVYLSPIFSWFKKDFGKNTEQILQFILPFLGAEDAQTLQESIKLWRIRFTPYDWSLNE